MPGARATEKSSDGVGSDLASLIRKTDAMCHLLKSIDQEPMKLLGEVCRQFEKIKGPVPDHNLHPSGYIGEIALKALVEAGLVKVHPAPRYSMFHYEPTEEGLRYYHNLSQAGYYERRR